MQDSSWLPARGPSPTVIRDWEEAGASLARAISHFFDQSTHLESQCTMAATTHIDLVGRIDSSLDLFQSTLDGQLTQARWALAKTRNRLIRATSILRLPEEILADIFCKFVYDPYEENQYSTSRSMNLHVQMIYRRVHTLLGVCATWRNIAISCGALWSVVPIVDPGVGRPRILSTDLSLERANNRGLHLAIFNPHQSYSRIKTLASRLSQFDSINISSDSTIAFEIDEIIRLMMKDKGPKLLSKLSLKHSSINSLPDEATFNPFTRLDPEFLDLIKSLSALRLGGVTVDWAGISFSSRLTELWISGVTLDEIPLVGFLSALSTATDLQHLKLINTRAMLDDDPGMITNAISFPKLKSLHFESLPFNFLKLLLDLIAPGPYHLTLNPCDDIHSNYPSEEWMEDTEICALLSRRPVHKLILAVEEQGFWELSKGLHSVLRAVPQLKTLVLNYYDIRSDILKALVPRSKPGLPKSTHPADTSFPKLEVLEIHGATFHSRLSEFKPNFFKILSHHPIQKIVLGGMVPIVPGIENSAPLGEDDDTVQWLKTKVPQLYVSLDPENAPDFVAEWQLWDI
ncbi:unnamed protein product [Rhizoctonia solani]|uniref:F-box domain-containing protein n=1 Tax=Rhizoctonia solani TaxID=456999 RepID=A0A8H3CNC9_9AGAM|nr:unnamed protein product [Rhizoctonia solani]